MVTLGDVVHVISGPRAGCRGRVRKLHDHEVQVELADGSLPGLRCWVPFGDVRVQASVMRPPKRVDPTRRPVTMESRPVCEHLYVANLCPTCRLRA